MRAGVKIVIWVRILVFGYGQIPCRSTLFAEIFAIRLSPAAFSRRIIHSPPDQALHGLWPMAHDPWV
jgi:hypothetical protein